MSKDETDNQPPPRDRFAEWRELQAFFDKGGRLPEPFAECPKHVVLPGGGQDYPPERGDCGICGGASRLSIHKSGRWMCHGASCADNEEFQLPNASFSQASGGDMPKYLQAVGTAFRRKSDPGAPIVRFSEVQVALASVGIAVTASGGKGKSPAKTDIPIPGRMAPGTAIRAQAIRGALAGREDTKAARRKWAEDRKNDPDELPALPPELLTPDHGMFWAVGDEPPETPKAAFATADEARPWVEKRGYKVIRLRGKRPVDKNWQNEATSDYAVYSKWTDAGFNLGVPAKLNGLIFVDVDRKNFLKILAYASPRPLKPGEEPSNYHKAVAAAKAKLSIGKDAVDDIDDWMLGFVQQAARDAGGLAHPTPGGGWHIEFLDDGETLPKNQSGGDLANVNLSKKECALQWPKAWCESRVGSGQVAIYKRDASLIDVEPRPVPDYLRKCFQAPNSLTITKADLELVEKLELEEKKITADLEKLHPSSRMYKEALARLPDFMPQLVKEHMQTKIVKKQEVVFWDELDVAVDFFERLGLQFLRDPARSENEDGFHKGGAYLMKPGDEWIEPNLDRLLTDILRAIGVTGAVQVGSKKAALKIRLAEHFKRGTKARADAPIPDHRQSGPNALKPMVLDASGKAISLAKGECGQPAIQTDEQPLLKRLGVTHDPDEKCPVWDKLARWAMQNKEKTRTDKEVQERVDYLEEQFAMPLYNGTHGNKHQFWSFFQGTGGNAKGATLDLMLALYGQFGIAIKAAPFFENKYSGDEKVGELQTLEGKWLAVMGEAPENKEWKTGPMKDSTGGKRISVRPMREAEREIAVTWYKFAQGNNIPRVAKGGKSWNRRRHLLVFDNEVAVEDQDPELASKLLREMPGIFNRLLAALERIYEKGTLIPPKHVAEVAEIYKQAEEGPVARFIDQYLVPSKEGRVLIDDVFEQYKKFLSHEDDRAIEEYSRMSMQRFRKELQEKFGVNKNVMETVSHRHYLLGYDLIKVEGPTKTKQSQYSGDRSVPYSSQRYQDARDAELAKEAADEAKARAEFEAADLLADDSPPPPAAPPAKEDIDAVNMWLFGPDGILAYEQAASVSLLVLATKFPLPLDDPGALVLACLKETEGMEVDESRGIPRLLGWKLK